MTDKIANYFKTKTPFIIISDFLASNVEVYTIDEAKKEGIFFEFNHNYIPKKHSLKLKKYPLSFESYNQKFNQVIEEIKKGNTYLLNLTQPTTIELNASLEEIFNKANATYKILYKDKFVCFSPESFIQIKDNNIYTYPMKGTIDAAMPNAKETILANQKEMAEHTMVVDLLRNDLGIIANEVKVEKFRYITKIDSGDKSLLQVSSKISAKLPKNFEENFYNLFLKLLPAGSISGTPKKSTIEIIKKIENYDRGFFSGVFGYFDSEYFDSCVMIRFIEKTKNGFVYKSGGGITLDSDSKAEYNELLDKVYLP
jgi:para-aminobenzoate synthetase component 1